MAEPIDVNLLSYTGLGTGAVPRPLRDRAVDVVNVRDFGAVGNGIVDDGPKIQAAFNYAMNQPAGHGINYHLNKPVFIPEGIYRVSAPLTINNTWGARISGASMTSTIINNDGHPDEKLLALNGVGYSVFEHMRLEADAGGIACDYFWDGGGAVGGQLNVFFKMSFGGIGGHGSPAYGCAVGNGGQQCDTSSWIDCLFGADVGIAFINQNAISHRILGGNLQSCRIGILCTGGSVQEINGVGFQESGDWDVSIQGGNGDCTHISGVSTESRNFVTCATLDCPVVIVGCSQRSSHVGSPGVFANVAGSLSIISCLSKGGIVNSGRYVTISNSQFWRIDAVDTFPYYSTTHLKVENSTFGIDEGSVGRHEMDTIRTAGGRRTRAIEGTSLTADSIINEGVFTSANATTFSPVAISLANPAVVSSTSWFNAGYNSHGFVDGTCIAFTTTPNSDTLPSGVVANTAYYVIRVVRDITGTGPGASNGLGGNKVRLTVATDGLATGVDVIIRDVLGTTEANSFKGVPIDITVIDATHCDLNFTTYANAYISGGILVTHNIFQISASPGGAPINCSGQSQSGDHSIYLPRMFAVGDDIKKSNVSIAGGVGTRHPGWICTTAGHAIAGVGQGTFTQLKDLV